MRMKGRLRLISICYFLSIKFVDWWKTLQVWERHGGWCRAAVLSIPITLMGDFSVLFAVSTKVRERCQYWTTGAVPMKDYCRWYRVAAGDIDARHCSFSGALSMEDVGCAESLLSPLLIRIAWRSAFSSVRRDDVMQTAWSDGFKAMIHRRIS